MATVLRNTAEGQPNTTALNAGNSGGGSGDPFDFVGPFGSSCLQTYSTDTFAHGSQSYKIQAAQDSNSGVTILRNVTSDVAGAIQSCIYMPTYASVNCLLMSIMNLAGSINIASLSINTDGSAWIADGGGNWVATSSAGLVPTSTWIRADLCVELGATQTTSRIQAAITIGDNATPAWTTDTGWTANFGSTNIGSYRWGKLDNTPNIALFYMDDMSSSSGAVSFIPAPQPNTSTAWLV